MRAVVVFVLILLARTSHAQQAAQVVLRLHPHLGDTLHTWLEQQTDVSTIMSGAARSVTTSGTTNVRSGSRCICAQPSIRPYGSGNSTAPFRSQPGRRSGPNRRISTVWNGSHVWGRMRGSLPARVGRTRSGLSSRRCSVLITTCRYRWASPAPCLRTNNGRSFRPRPGSTEPARRCTGFR